jgi:hypothetical protein
MYVFFSRLLGEEPGRTARYYPGSRRRIHMLGTAMLIPVVLWFVSTLLLVSEVMQKPWYIALLAAAIAAMLILMIERAIVMAPGKNNALLGFRLILGVLIASLGAMCIDEVVFKEDIDQKVAVLNMEMADQAARASEAIALPALQQQEARVAQAYTHWQLALEEARREADGTGGSGRARVGRIAYMKQQHADKLEEHYLRAQQQLESLQQQIRQEAGDVRTAIAGTAQPHGLLIRIRALFALIFEDGFVMFFYVLFTLFFFCLEFIVILLKMTAPPTTDEQLEVEAEALLLHRARRTAERARAYGNGAEGMPVYREAKRLAGSTLPSVL